MLGDLNLQPLIGRVEAGSVLARVVVQQPNDWQLTEVQVAGKTLTGPQIGAPVDAAMLRFHGSTVRLRIRACDKPLQGEGSESNSSASDHLQGLVLQVLNRDGPHCRVWLVLTPPEIPLRSGATLWALLTRRSGSNTGLHVGQTVIASFEAAAVEWLSVAAFG